MSHPRPPGGYSLRDARVDDAPAIADVINETNVAEVGDPWTNAEQVRSDLTSPNRARSDHAVLVDGEGGIVAYLELWPDADPFTAVTQLAFVRPALWGRGLSAWLLRTGEDFARDRLARAPEPETIALRVARWANNEDAGRLFASLGYRPVRTFWTLRRELDPAAAEPVAPGGIEIRRFDPATDAVATHAALREAFHDHWGHTYAPFDEWMHEFIDSEGSGFDAALWFVAVEGPEIVGAISGREHDPSASGAGYVQELGVRAAWRRRGIARALLLAVFAELRARGVQAVELGVDSENATGATRLYDSVGMRTTRVSDTWEKPIERRPA